MGTLKYEARKFEINDTKDIAKENRQLKKDRKPAKNTGTKSQ